MFNISLWKDEFYLLILFYSIATFSEVVKNVPMSSERVEADDDDNKFAFRLRLKDIFHERKKPN